MAECDYITNTWISILLTTSSPYMSSSIWIINAIPKFVTLFHCPWFQRCYPGHSMLYVCGVGPASASFLLFEHILWCLAFGYIWLSHLLPWSDQEYTCICIRSAAGVVTRGLPGICRLVVLPVCPYIWGNELTCRDLHTCTWHIMLPACRITIERSLEAGT